MHVADAVTTTTYVIAFDDDGDIGVECVVFVVVAVREYARVGRRRTMMENDVVHVPTSASTTRIAAEATVPNERDANPNNPSWCSTWDVTRSCYVY